MSLSDHAPEQARPLSVSARQLAIMAVLLALSVVGAMIKIPSPYGTVAFDAAPGYFAAAAYGWIGVVVIAIGHLLTAGIVGFPLTPPVHLMIAAGMGVCALVFQWFARRKGLVWLSIGAVAAILLNSFGLGLIMLPIGGWAAYFAVLPSLLIGSVANVLIATIAYQGVRDSKLLR